LDTNLWSSIGDEMARKAFDDFLRSRSLDVVVPPSILVEVINLPVPEARQRIIEALARGPRQRLATEAQSECAEVVSEARRLRPRWLRSMPDTTQVWLLNTFWTKKIWRRAQIDSQPFHDYQKGLMARHRILVERQRDNRTRMLQSGFKPGPLTEVVVTPDPDAPESYLAGWNREPVEMWRVANRDIYWRELSIVSGRAILTKEDTTIADWVGSYVDLTRLRSNHSDFTKFWFQDVDLNAMRRNWLRWAVDLAQFDYKVTGGNPADAQHSSYLLDCDLFLSADARYVDVLKLVRGDAPFNFAEPRLVSGDRTMPIIDRLTAAL
jgi:hypothetical protein